MTTRERLERAFDLRGTPKGTREAYGWCVGRYERFFGKPADALGREEVETYLLHLVRDRKLSPSTHNVYAAALRSAGVPVRLTEYVGMPHGYLNFPGVCRAAPQALAEICAEQIAALGSGVGSTATDWPQSSMNA